MPENFQRPARVSETVEPMLNEQGQPVTGQDGQQLQRTRRRFSPLAPEPEADPQPNIFIPQMPQQTGRTPIPSQLQRPQVSPDQGMTSTAALSRRRRPHIPMGREAIQRAPTVRADPSFWGDTVPAFFKREHVIGSWLTGAIRGFDLEHRDDPSFDPLQELLDRNLDGQFNEEGENYLLEQGNRQDFVRALETIRREEDDTRAVHRAGFVGSIGASVITGVTDPVAWIPVGGAVARASSIARIGGRSLFQNFGRRLAASSLAGAAGGFTYQTTAEVISLQPSQVTRTSEESGFNIAASTIFGGVLGGATGGISRLIAVEYDSIRGFLPLPPTPDDAPRLTARPTTSQRFSDLMGMRVQDLREQMRQRGIRGARGDRKGNLVQRIIDDEVDRGVTRPGGPDEAPDRFSGRSGRHRGWSSLRNQDYTKRHDQPYDEARIRENLPEGVHLVYGEGAGRYDPETGLYTPSFLRENSDGTFTLFMDEAFLREDFANQPWAQSNTGIAPLPRGTFQNVDEWVDFVFRHEMLHRHRILQRRAGEEPFGGEAATRAQEENIINRILLDGEPVMGRRDGPHQVRINPEDVDHDMSFQSFAEPNQRIRRIKVLNAFGIPVQSALDIGDTYLQKATGPVFTLLNRLDSQRFGANGAIGLRSLMANPSLRMATSGLASANRLVQRLVPSNVYYQSDIHGIASTANAHNLAKKYFGIAAAEMRFAKDMYKKYRTRAHAAGETVLNRTRFMEEVGKAHRRGDFHPITEVQSVAQHARRNLLDPLTDEAIELGLVSREEVEAMRQSASENRGHPGASWLRRMFDNTRIRDPEWGFVEGLTEQLQRNANLDPENARFTALRIQEAILNDPVNLSTISVRNSDLDPVHGRLGGLSDAFYQKWLDEDNVIRWGDEGAENAPEVFERELAQEYMNQGMSESRATSRAQGVRQSIERLQNKPRLNPGDRDARGALFSRKLHGVDEGWLENFLVSDAEALWYNTAKVYGAEIGLNRVFGNSNLGPEIRAMREEAVQKARQARQQGRQDIARRIMREYRVVSRDARAIRDDIRGMYGIPENPDGLLARVPRAAMSASYIATGGMITLSSIPDIAYPVMRFGLTRTLRDGWGPFVRTMVGGRDARGRATRALKLLKKENELAGQGLEASRSMIIHNLFNMQQHVGGQSRLESALRGAEGMMGYVNLMNYWTSAMQQVNGHATMNWMLRNARDIVNNGGRGLSRQDRMLMSRVGIDDDMARRIWRQFQSKGEDIDGIWAPQTHRWLRRMNDLDADPEAAMAFRNGIETTSQMNVIVGGVPDRPLWASSSWGRMATMYMNFAFAAVPRLAMMPAQARDKATMNGILAAVSMGGMTEWIRNEIAGSPQPTDPAQWTVSAVDRSGVTGWFFHADHLVSKATAGHVGVSPYTDHRAGRFFSAGDMLGLAFGPPYSTARDAVQGTAAVTVEGPNPDSVQQLRRSIPYNNVFWLRRMFDQMEEVAATEPVPDRALGQELTNDNRNQ